MLRDICIALIIGIGLSLTTTADAQVAARLITGQAKVAVTGTAVPFTATNFPLANGVQYCALAGNSAAITVGFSTVNNTTNGTGNGEVLQPGACNSKAVNNVNLMFLNGTSGDGLSFGGN